jgi:hypothetical protein
MTIPNKIARMERLGIYVGIYLYTNHFTRKKIAIISEVAMVNTSLMEL